MLPPFYDMPLHKDVNIYLKQIEEEFSIKIAKYLYLKWAFGNDVFIINDEVVFRFPRAKQAINHLPYEIDFLNFLKTKVTVHIPHYSYISKSGDFAGYNIITGKILTPSTFRYLSRESKEEIVSQLIAFVNDLHRISLNDFKKYKPGKREDYIPIETKIEHELEEKLFPKLSEKKNQDNTEFLQRV